MAIEFRQPRRTRTGVTIEIRVEGLKSEATFVLHPDGSIGGPLLSLHGWGDTVQGKGEKEEAAMDAAKKYLAQHKAQIQALLSQPAK